MQCKCSLAVLYIVLLGGSFHHVATTKAEEHSLTLELSAHGQVHEQENQHLRMTRDKPLDDARVSMMRSVHFRHKEAQLQEKAKRDKEQQQLHARIAGACQIDAQMKKCDAEHMNTCRWPEPKKFDLVISWTTQKNQSDIKTHGPAAFVQTSSSAGIENQAEIKYALRSFEKHGLLDYVGTVYVLMDQAKLEKFGAPRFFDYGNRHIRIVTERDLDMKYDHPKANQFLALDKIPGISDYFLWIPDDNFMQQPFKMDYLYDSAQGKPFIYSFGTYSLGWCDSMPWVGSTHGPVLFNKCAYSVIAEHYWRLRAANGSLASVRSTVRSPTGMLLDVDAVCLYSRALHSRVHFEEWTNNSSFQRECHTNSINQVNCEPFTPEEAPLFLDMQGNGISDEYSTKIDQNSWWARELMPHGPARWFRDQYPAPSRYEKK